MIPGQLEGMAAPLLEAERLAQSRFRKENGPLGVNSLWL